MTGVGARKKGRMIDSNRKPTDNEKAGGFYVLRKADISHPPTGLNMAAMEPSFLSSGPQPSKLGYWKYKQ